MPTLLRQKPWVTVTYYKLKYDLNKNYNFEKIQYRCLMCARTCMYVYIRERVIELKPFLTSNQFKIAKI